MRKQHLAILVILTVSLTSALLLWFSAKDNHATDLPDPPIYTEPEEEKLGTLAPLSPPNLSHGDEQNVQTNSISSEASDEEQMEDINFDLPETITDFWAFAKSHPQLLQQLEDCDLAPGPIKEALDNTEASFEAMGQDINYISGGSPTSDYHSYDTETLEQMAINGDRRAISLQGHILKKAGERNNARDQFYRAALYGDIASLTQLQQVYLEGAREVRRDKEKTPEQKDAKKHQLLIEAQAWHLVQHNWLGMFAYGDPEDNSVIGNDLTDEIQAAAMVRAEQLEDGLNIQRRRQNIPAPTRPPQQINTDALFDSIVCP